jgi:hypothetical protein
MLSLTGSDDRVTATPCANRSCDHASAGSPVISGKPTLIDFHDSMLDRRGLASRAGTKIERRLDFAKWLRTRLLGANMVAPANGKRFVGELRKLGASQRVLIVGETPREAGDINIVSFHSKEIELLADGEPMAPRETISYYPGVR